MSGRPSRTRKPTARAQETMDARAEQAAQKAATVELKRKRKEDSASGSKRRRTTASGSTSQGTSSHQYTSRVVVSSQRAPARTSVPFSNMVQHHNKAPTRSAPRSSASVLRTRGSVPPEDSDDDVEQEDNIEQADEDEPEDDENGDGSGGEDDSDEVDDGSEAGHDDEETDVDVPEITQEEIDDDDFTRGEEPPRAAERLVFHGGRARAADFDTEAQEVIEEACSLYRLGISTEVPFPKAPIASTKSREVWWSAAQDLKLYVAPVPDILKIVMQRGPQMRGEIKTKARPIVQSVFGFRIGEAKAILRKNRALAESLLEDDSFIYKDVENRIGAYRHPVFQDIIVKAFYENSFDEAIKYSKTFNPSVPGVTLALTVTVVKNCIDEWVSGRLVGIPFQAVAYSQEYERQLASLANYERRSIASGKGNIVKVILTKINSNGRFAAGALPDRKVAPALAGDAFDADIEAWAGGSTFGSDDEESGSDDEDDGSDDEVVGSDNEVVGSDVDNEGEVEE